MIANNDLFVASRDGYLYAFGNPLPKPSSAITLYSPANVKLGQNVALSGKLSDQDGVGFANANVTLQERLVSAIDWNNLTTVPTDGNGNFNYAWTPQVPGYYDVAANFTGDGLAPSVETSIINVASPQPAIDVTPLIPYLIGIIVLEVVLIALLVATTYAKRRQKE